MDLLIIRHAIAEEREEFAKTGESDDRRPLSADGRAKMTKGAEGLREIAPEISLLVSSPLVRADETAEIVGRVYGLDARSTTEALRPEAPLEEFTEWASDCSGQHVVAIVGHNPHLSRLASWLLSGHKHSLIDLKKGGACLLTFDGMPKAGAGTLEWLLRPSHLRALAGRGS